MDGFNELLKRLRRGRRRLAKCGHSVGSLACIMALEAAHEVSMVLTPAEW